MAGGDEARATEYLVLGVSKRSTLGRAKRTIDSLFNRLDKAVLAAVSAPRAAYALPAATVAPPTPPAPSPKSSAVPSSSGSVGSSLAGAAVGFAFAMLPKVIEGATDFASSVVSGAKEKAGEFFSTALTATRSALTTAGKWVTESAQGVAKAAREGASYLVDKVKEGAGTVGDVLREQGSAVWDKVTSTYDSVKSSAVAIVKTQTAVPTSLVMQSRDAVFGLWEETKKTVRSWLWDILNVFNNSGPVEGQGGGSAAATPGNRAGHGRRDMVGRSGGSFDPAVKTPAATGGYAGGTGAYRGFSGSATMTPEESKQLSANAQKFSSTSGGIGSEKNPFFDAIIKAEGTAKRGDPYNTSLGYTKSPKPLTEMTMGEVLAWGDHIRKNTAIGQRTNSSAKGAFQIVNTTQRDAMRALGIGMDEKFSPENQRRMAAWIAKKQGLGAWEGFKNHPDQLQRAQQNQDQRDNWRDPPPTTAKTKAVPVPDGAPITGDLSAPPGLFDSKKNQVQRPPAIYSGQSVRADSLGFGGKADFGRGISNSDSDKPVEPTKRFETRPDKPAEEGGSSPQSSKDGEEPDNSDSPSERRKRHAIMMNNDAGTYLISHQEALA